MSKQRSRSKAPKRKSRKKRVADKLKSNVPQATGTRAVVSQALRFQQAGNFDQAQLLYRQVLNVDPTNADAWHLLGMTFFAVNQFESAIECLQTALKLTPDQPDFLANLGVLYRGAGNLALAKTTLEKAVRLSPDSVNAANNLGTVYLECGKLDEAEYQFQSALSLDASFDQAAMNLGNVWQKQGRARDAEGIYRRLLSRQANDSRLLNNLGESLRNQGKWQEAVEVISQAVHLDPNAVEARLNLGRCLARAGRSEEAQAEFVQLIDRYPERSRPYHFLGKLQFEQRNMDRAVKNIEHAVKLAPKDAFASSSLGFVYLELGQRELAESCFRKAIEVDPTMSQAHGCLLFLMSGQAELDQQLLFEEHKNWGKIHGAVEPLRTNGEHARAKDRQRDRKLRIGYVSPDFRNHAVASFFLPVLRSHNSEQVETFCYGEVSVPDDVTQRIQELSDHWRFTCGLSDEQIANRVMEDQIDILIDLAGHTGQSRVRVFAFKPAPIQVTWLGYPNTTGLDSIDYRLTCEIQNPLNEPTFHTEQLFRMPRGSFCFSRPKNAPELNPLPASSNGYVTFGSLHRPDKISETACDLWANVLNRCPASRMIVFHTRFTDQSRAELIKAMLERGITADRFEVRNQLNGKSHLQIYNQIDVALDVTPWAGGTTTLEAAWMGVPVIAYYGDRRSSRSTAAILKCIGHEELIAYSAEEYVQLAKQLTDDLPRMIELRKNLRDKTANTVADSNRFTRDLETSFRTMWHRWCDGMQSGV